MSAFSVENPHDGKMFENYTRFEWGVEVGVVTIFILRLFVPHEFDMLHWTKFPGNITNLFLNKKNGTNVFRSHYNGRQRRQTDLNGH